MRTALIDVLDYVARGVVLIAVARESFLLVVRGYSRQTIEAIV